MIPENQTVSKPSTGDLEAFEEALLWLSCLVEEILEISELDLNPIFAFPPDQGCLIVDARILMFPETP